ncbi:hypothetical protein JHD49_09410 [Sulfurimonas sp. SAG-AH-194-C21]|nr:hypothetical protein [Sulfurimonas sp. SAG-AH-194-C21]MDF1884156.1 hypothetical protein [Sulfurimonas sp. SAG-AH-194-C21]
MLTQADISDVELKQRWRLYWINCIFDYSSLKFQELSWVNNSQKWPSSFAECTSAYFDNLGLYKGYAQAIAAGNVSEVEAQKASTFHDLANFYDEPSQNPRDILGDEEWLEVVEAAAILWVFLKDTLSEPREIQLIEKLEKEFS